MKIQVDIPAELNKELKILKAKFDCNNLSQVVIICIESYLKSSREVING